MTRIKPETLSSNLLGTIAVTLANPCGGLWRTFYGNRQRIVRSFIRLREPLPISGAVQAFPNHSLPLKLLDNFTSSLRSLSQPVSVRATPSREFVGLVVGLQTFRRWWPLSLRQAQRRRGLAAGLQVLG